MSKCSSLHSSILDWHAQEFSPRSASHQTTLIVREEYKEMAYFMLKQSYIVVMKAEM
jgi:hypothetical protein